MKYEKYSGAGNNFIIINNIEGIIKINEQRELTIKLCSNEFPDIDGVIFVERPFNLGSSIRMNYYNRDGSFGVMCGNGARCIAMYGYKNSIVKDRIFVLEALNQLYYAEILNNVNVKIKFPVPLEIIQDINLDIEINNRVKKLKLNYVNVGSDHAVIFIDEDINKIFFGCKNLDEVELNKIGSVLRNHSKFSPRGVNVNLAEIDLNKIIHLRTYERGVERETLACGTGIISTGIIAMIKRGFIEPIQIKVQSGEILLVNGNYSDNKIKDLALSGSAVMISEGELE